MGTGTVAILADGLFRFLLAATESWLAQGGRVGRDSLVDHLLHRAAAAWATVPGADTLGGSVLTAHPDSS